MNSEEAKEAVAGTPSLTLVTGDSNEPRDKCAVLQISLAAYFANVPLNVQATIEGVQYSAIPRPFLVTLSGEVFFAPLAAVCAILEERPFDFDSLAGGDIAEAIFSGKPVNAIPEGLVNQIALFSAIHVYGQSDAVKSSLSSDLANFAAEFAKKPQVWEAMSKVGDGVHSRQRCVRDGVAWEYDWSIKRVPIEGSRNILITSALPYVNNVPHLGNIIGALLSADVFARYCRARKYNVIYICGTDEYGTATETKALEEGLTCQQVCNKYFRVHADVYDWFQIKCDIFGRTSTPQQTEITHDIFRKLYDNGYFFEDSVEQSYCETCTRFLADRYIEGICPLCAFPDARGDQCDGCGKLINPIELISAKCKLCKSTPTIRSSKHLFLDLTKLQPSLTEWLEESSQKGKWSSNSAAISKAWLTEGLKPRCMTRDLKWGTKVPVPGFEDKVFYVWFDAPIGYVSITANYTDEWEKWWKNPDQVQLYQFMGKDNVPFHAVIFPSTLIGTNDKYTLLHHISTTEYLNYESGKFSKSRCTGVFGNDARDSGIPASVWRYYLLSTRPEASDSVFTWDEFAAKTNSELLANFGNYINRTCKFAYSKMAGVLGPVELSEFDEAFMSKVDVALGQYHDEMEQVKIRGALKTVMAISALGNAFLQDCKLDNRLLTSEPSRCSTVIAIAINLAYLLATIVEPFLPSTAADIYSILNAPSRAIPAAFTLDLLPGHSINQPFILFNKLEEQFVKDLRAKYAGKQH